MMKKMVFEEHKRNANHEKSLKPEDDKDWDYDNMRKADDFN